MLGIRLQKLSGLVFIVVLGLQPTCVLAQQYMVNGKPVSESFAEAMKLVNQAIASIQAGKIEDALAIGHHAVTLAPESALTHAVLGSAEARSNDPDSAIEEYKQAVAIDDQRPEFWYSLGSVYQSAGRSTEAIDTFKQFLKRFPDNPRCKLVKSGLTILEKELKTRPASSSINGDDYFGDATKLGEAKWAATRMPLTVCILSGLNVDEFKPEYADLAKEAFLSWASASAGKVSFQFVEKPNNADITLRWSTNSKDLSQPAEGGEAKVMRRGERINSATIVVLTIMPVKELVMNDQLMHFICLHEIGHALGIVGHSPNRADVMYCSIPLSFDKCALTERDAKTLQHIYLNDVKPISATKTSAGFVDAQAEELALDQAARKQFENGNIEESIRLYRKASDQYPSSHFLKTNLASVLNNGGLSAFKEQNFEKAIGLFEQALEIEPTDKIARSNLGSAYINLGVQLVKEDKLAQAEPSFKMAVETLSGNDDKKALIAAVRNYIYVLNKLGRSSEAQDLEAKYLKSP